MSRTGGERWVMCKSKRNKGAVASFTPPKFCIAQPVLLKIGREMFRLRKFGFNPSVSFFERWWSIHSRRLAGVAISHGPASRQLRAD
jgi:hypothetical protein